MDLESLGVGKRDGIARLASGADLGDLRLSRRAGSITEALVANPDSTPAKSLGSEAEAEAYYRFLRNPKTGWAELVAPHVEATLGRLAALGVALALYDQTAIIHGGGRDGEGFYPLTRGRHGYMAHVGMAVSASPLCPLGLVGLHVIERDPRGLGRAERQKLVRQTPHEERESAIWARMAIEAAESVGDRARLVHVMDREADSYGTFDALMGEDQLFVVRAKHNRKLDDRRLDEVSLAATTVAEREIYLSRRKGHTAPKTRRTHPPRPVRPARLELKATAVTLRRPSKGANPAWAEQLELNVVRVVELNPPEGQQPVDWTLLTSLPVNTPEEVERVVDAYRARWLIEELFAALKTGCAFNNRLFESLRTSSTALALTLPIAIHLLQLRFLSRHASETSARKILPRARLMALRHHPNAPELAIEPTVQQVLLAIARIGGHLRSNGPPGWKVIGRGYIDLLRFEEGFVAAIDAMKAAGQLTPEFGDL